MTASRPIPAYRDETIHAELVADLAPLVAARPTTAHRTGLAVVRGLVEDRLRDLGFTVSERTRADHPAIVVATRPGSGRHWVGLSGHYDVQVAGDRWTSAPHVLTERGGRIYGRGVADNLGPLALRLRALRRAERLPSLAWVLQGEEEIGSPAAHELFPWLRLPPMTLWLEETGYFELDGSQRLLVRRPSATTTPWIDAAVALASASGRAVARYDRYLNKAFGVQRCPFLTHLVGDATYLAIGPNDPLAHIHGADESLPRSNLDLSSAQFLAVLQAAAVAA